MITDNVLNTNKVNDIINKEKYSLKLKRNEFIWHKGLRGIRRGGLSFAMTKEERKEYIKCKLSVYYFAQKFCHIKREDGSVGQITLRKYQKDIIKLFHENRYSILMASRQSGKTVSTSIYILWYILFNDNKGVMIVANKSKTTKEIINKIKGIYKLLPFYLKVGVVNWNENSIALDNDSRIQTEARTSEPAIGFTIDLLYLDEFAKVPDTIVRKYYGEVVPIVSSIDNSKIIITSTPDGFNLFWEILTGAEKPIDDDNYNGYKSMRVYWYEKEGRRDTKIILHKSKLKKYRTTKTYIKTYLKKLNYKIYEKNDVFYIKFFKDQNETIPLPKSSINDIKKIIIKIDDKNVPLLELGKITNWEEEQTRLIGGESMFRQEYGLEFLTDDKTLFDTIKFHQMTKNLKEYKYINIPSFNDKLHLPYNNLQFVDNNPNIFDINKIKSYYIFIGIDLSEGLGLDYSVINIFRLMPKDINLINDIKDNVISKYEYFKLEQIGMWISNIYKINELAHILYMIVFEFFNPENVRIVVESNKNLGQLLFNAMPYVFNGNNDYGDYIFLRFKHNQNDKYHKKGLIIGRDKKYMIKEFQDNILKDNLSINNKHNIIELKSFAKKETPSGDITYKSQTGHDDMVMSLVNLTAVFNHNIYKEFIELYIETELTDEYRKIFNNVNDNDNNNNNNIISTIHNKIYKKNTSQFFNKNIQIQSKNISDWYKL